MLLLTPLWEGDMVSEYSSLAVGDLVSVVFPYGTHKGMLAMFTAYFDESGTHSDAPNIAIGGFLGSDSQWSSFQSQWARGVIQCAGHPGSRYAAASCSQYLSQSPLARTTRSESMGCTLSAFHQAPGNLRRC